MPSRFHRTRQRRAERAAGESSERLNLVPLVDILTSIVFYALLAATTAGGTLLAFDLSPSVAALAGAGAGAAAEAPPPPITVMVRHDRTVIRRGTDGAEIVLAQPAGLDRAALDQLGTALNGLRRGPGAVAVGTPAVVVPGDDVSYERVVGVLERLRQAEFRQVSLGMVARKS